MTKKKQKLLLAIVLLLSFVLRFYKLGQIPPSIDWDEAAIGYNSYSLLQTGKDEYGISWPLAFRSFGDYKPPLYIYLTVPAIVIFGLTEFAVRFPSALFGTLTVLLTYLFVKELFRISDYKIAILSALLLSVSPWHLYFSRVAFEANVGIFFNILGTYLFLKAVRKNGWWMTGSALSYGLGLYAYHSERVFIPLLILGLLILFRAKLWEIKKELTISFLFGLAFLVPLVKILSNSVNLTRLQSTSVFEEKTQILARSVERLERAQNKGSLLGKILSNRRITYGQVLIGGYLSHYNFNWLFITGDNERHKAPGVGLLYWWELPFLLAGIYYIVRGNLDKRAKMLVFWWFLISPVAASPTIDIPHSVRTLVFLPIFQIFTAYGIVSALQGMEKAFSTKALVLSATTYLVLIAFNTAYFLDSYFIHLPLEYAKFWQFGYKQTADYIRNKYNGYDKFIISENLEQPYIFLLFYLQYSPRKYLDSGGTAKVNLTKSFDKFQFKKFAEMGLNGWENKHKTLFIGKPDEVSGKTAYSVNYPDGSEAIRFTEGFQ